MPHDLVIFDMDGTLTEELLDFPAIRGEIGVPEGAGILEHISHLPGLEQGRARDILHRHELAAARNCRLHEGAAQVLAALRALGVKTALLTRNSPMCVQEVLRRHGLLEAWDHLATRDDAPHKPHPESILRITRKLGVPVRRALMVGDYLYDMQAAEAAGCDSALLLADGPPPAFAGMATYRISRLMDVLDIVRRTNGN